MGLNVLYKDPCLAVCVKPVGLSSETALPALLEEELGGRFYCVHRLDQAVGGVMVFARDGKSAAALSAGEALREKRYLAVVQGVPEPETGIMEDLLFHDSGKNKTFVVSRERRGVKKAALDYTLLGTAAVDGRPVSLVAVRLRTGRSHQIRVQFASRKMPLLGDRKYGSAFAGCPVALWARELAFVHPTGGELLRFTAPPPEGWPWSLFPSDLWK